MEFPHEPLDSVSDRGAVLSIDGGRAPSDASRRPRRVTISLAAAILAAGIFGVPAIAERRSDDGPAAQLRPDEPAAVTPETDIITDPPQRPWLEPTDVPLSTDGIQTAVDVQRTRIEQCRLEYGTMTAVALAFVTQTRSVPDDPDVVESTWLNEVPDGWNDEWDFEIVSGGLVIVPTPGGTCDL